MATPRKKVAPRKKVVGATKKAVKKAPSPPRTRTRHHEPTMTRDVVEAAVTELPGEYAVNPRRFRFAKVMREIREQVDAGKLDANLYVPLGEFVGKQGAWMVKRAMELGDRPVDGEVEEWELEHRRNAETGGSTLFARLR